MKIRNILLGALVSAVAISASAQEPLVIEPLFQYPTAPEEMIDLQQRSDWLMEHFWDSMDLKSRQSVDQNALNDAFSVYATPMRFADATKTEESVNRLISSIAKNPILSLQFAKAAEEGLYGPRAQWWNDDIYLKFIDNVIRNKSIKKERKLKYTRIKEQLSNTLRGTIPPEFDYITVDGKTAHYHPNGVITVIEFGDPDCDDCRHAKLKMDTDVRFNQLLEKGAINVLFINPEPEEGWQEKMSGYPQGWHVGASETVSDIYDLRTSPSIYVIDREGRIAAKHVGVETAMQLAIAAAEQ